jgi:hypothetical protein
MGKESQLKWRQKTPKTNPRFFSHPDFNRRLWNFTKSTELELFQDLIRVAGFTAGSDFH